MIWKQHSRFIRICSYLITLCSGLSCADIIIKPQISLSVPIKDQIPLKAAYILPLDFSQRFSEPIYVYENMGTHVLYLAEPIREGVNEAMQVVFEQVAEVQSRDEAQDVHVIVEPELEYFDVQIFMPQMILRTKWTVRTLDGKRLWLDTITSRGRVTIEASGKWFYLEEEDRSEDKGRSCEDRWNQRSCFGPLSQAILTDHFSKLVNRLLAYDWWSAVEEQ